jgi:hypothetical protein
MAVSDGVRAPTSTGARGRRADRVAARLPVDGGLAALERLGEDELASLRREAEAELAEPGRWGTTFTLIQSWGRLEGREVAAPRAGDREMPPAWVQQRTMSHIEIRCSLRVKPGAGAQASQPPTTAA